MVNPGGPAAGSVNYTAWNLRSRNGSDMARLAVVVEFDSPPKNE